MTEFFLQNEYWFAATQLLLAMIGMGATLKLSDFKDILFEPRSIIIGTTAQLVIVPILAYLLILLTGISGGIAISIALIASIPGGTVSNIFTHFAKGNSALSISITSVTTLACLVTTPLILELLISDYMPTNFEMPTARIAIEIGTFLLLPLTLGMMILHFKPESANTFSKWCIRGSLLVILMMVIGSSTAGRLDLQAFGITNTMVILGFFIILMIAMAILTRVMHLGIKDRTAIEMEIIVRNVNLGLLINASLFPVVANQDNSIGNTVLLAILLFGGLQLLIGALAIWFYRLKSK